MRQFICLWTRLFVILSFCVVGSLPLGAVGSSIDYFTAIKRACDKGTLKCVNTWEKEHPNANYRNMADDEFGDTPMHHAVRHNGPVELLVHLMNRGLYDADRGNAAGQTVMQLAQAQDDDVQEEGSTRVSNLEKATELAQQQKQEEKNQRDQRNAQAVAENAQKDKQRDLDRALKKQKKEFAVHETWVELRVQKSILCGFPGKVVNISPGGKDIDELKSEVKELKRDVKKLKRVTQMKSFSKMDKNELKQFWKLSLRDKRLYFSHHYPNMKAACTWALVAAAAMGVSYYYYYPAAEEEKEKGKGYLILDEVKEFTNS